jgi:8-amino-7-oxononanoate synthase
MLNFREEIESLQKKNLYRTLRVLSGAPSARVEWNGREFINFSSNNYLGLSQDDRVKKAACAALERYGLGGTSSRSLAGTLEIHRELEDALARFLGYEAALVFSSGYHANVGLIRALMGDDDVVCIDRAVHASVIDACRLSSSRFQVFHHNDPSHLERILKRSRARRRLVVTEGIFSMDGDAAPLKDITRLCRIYGAVLVVDEAHAFGVLGEGRGAAAEEGVLESVDFYVGTLSKALGSQGGFVCGSREAIDILRNKSRSFIYTTALAPACAAGALEALAIVRREPQRRKRALALADRMRSSLEAFGFDTLNSVAHIVPVFLGGEENALSVSMCLERARVLAPAIRPPTVPRGLCRLRFSLTTDHDESDIEKVVGLMKPLRRREAAVV